MFLDNLGEKSRAEQEDYIHHLSFLGKFHLFTHTFSHKGLKYTCTHKQDLYTSISVYSDVRSRCLSCSQTPWAVRKLTALLKGSLTVPRRWTTGYQYILHSDWFVQSWISHPLVPKPSPHRPNYCPPNLHPIHLIKGRLASKELHSLDSMHSNVERCFCCFLCFTKLYCPARSICWKVIKEPSAEQVMLLWRSK